MSIISERNRIDRVLGKYPTPIQNKVVARINNYKKFAGIEHLAPDTIEYITYNELEKVIQDEDISSMPKKSYEWNFAKNIGLIGMMVALVLTIFNTSLKAEQIEKSIVLTDVAHYIKLQDCNVQDRTWYSVCWDNTLNVAVSGWTIIDSELIDSENIKKRPNFYKDKIVKTLSSSSITLPNHNGHTFANDSDNDYSTNPLKSTYNMINITAMHGTINVGIWRKIENRGKELSRLLGEVISVTMVEYFPDSRYNIPGPYPKSYTRIYIMEDGDECYKVDNIDRKSSNLLSYKIDCLDIQINKNSL